jgi:hypothetical protein
VEAAQQLVRSIRLRGGGFTVSAFGFGAGGSQSESLATPPEALLLDGHRVMRERRICCGAFAIKPSCTTGCI